MTKEEAIKALRALAVLYYGADEEMQRLAENEFSGCASTQRNKLNELESFLKIESRKLTTQTPNPIVWSHDTLGAVIKKGT
jgi:hypothetical protein